MSARGHVPVLSGDRHMRATRMRPEELRNLALRLPRAKAEQVTDVSEDGPEGGFVYKVATYTNINT